MVDKKIRGITVEIGGDTTKLGKAIENSEKHTRNLQTELRQVEKLLKFDPTNTELLAQKQNILKDAIGETAKKLETLEEAEAQVIAQFERGDIAEDQLRAFQREIIQTKTDLSKMQTELSATERSMENLSDGTDKAKKNTKEYRDSVENASKELEEFKGKANEAFDAIKTGATVLGGAIVATGGYALKLSTDFDKAFNTLVTKTGASNEELDSLNQTMENIYANNFGESIEDVANSMAIVKNTTGLANEELKSVTQNALLMRDTFDFEVNESIRAVNSLMDQFGITADEAYNLIAQGAQNGLNQNDDLLDVINEYSVQFESAGYTAEDMFNMLVNGVESGTWSVDKLGDAVKEFNIRMSDGSAKDAVEALGFSWEEVSSSWSAGGDEAKEVFNMLVNELDGLENTTNGYSIGVGLLGTMFEDLGFDAVYALSQTEGEISKTSDALGKINETKYDDIGSALQGLGRTLQTDLIQPLGEDLKPVVEEAISYVNQNGPQIREMISSVASKVGEFVGFLVDNGTTILSIITGISAGMLAWNVATIISSVVGAINAFKLANEGATIAQALFNAVLNANPLMLIVTVITAVITAIITFVATNEDARTKILEIWQKLTDGIGKFVQSIGKFFTETLPNFFKSLIEWVKANWQSILLFLINPFAGLFQYFYDNNHKFREFVDNAIAEIKQLPGKVWTWLQNTIDKVSKFVTDIIAKAKKAGQEFVNNITNTIKTLPEKLKSIGADIISGLWTGMANKATWLKEQISGFVGDVTGWLKSFFKIKSPSRLMRDEIGRYISEGIGVGITENKDKPIDALEQLGNEMVNYDFNGATINRKLTATFSSDSVATNSDNLLTKLDNIYEKLGRLQVVLDTGTLVGETIDKIDSGLATRQSLRARGV